MQKVICTRMCIKLSELGVYVRSWELATLFLNPELSELATPFDALICKQPYWVDRGLRGD